MLVQGKNFTCYATCKVLVVEMVVAILSLTVTVLAPLNKKITYRFENFFHSAHSLR